MPGPLNYLGRIRSNRKFQKALKHARSSRNLLNNLPRSPIRQYVPRRMPMFTPRTPLTFFSPLPNRRNTPRMFFSPMPNMFLPPQPKKRKGFFGGILKKKRVKY